MDWQTLIEERDEWIAHNFPDNELPKPQESILGLIEEIGELAHSHLKELQHIRGTDEEHQANAKDAIGDATVYLLGVMAKIGYAPDPQYGSRHPGPDEPHWAIFGLSEMAGMLARAIPPGPGILIDDIILYLRAYCQLRGWDYEEIVMDTWNKVKQRDWIVDPAAGGE